MEQSTKTLYFENVTCRIDGQIIFSTIRIATEEEIAEAKRLHLLNQCPHNIVYDKSGWLYDERICATCDMGLGLV